MPSPTSRVFLALLPSAHVGTRPICGSTPSSTLTHTPSCSHPLASLFPSHQHDYIPLPQFHAGPIAASHTSPSPCLPVLTPLPGWMRLGPARPLPPTLFAWLSVGTRGSLFSLTHSLTQSDTHSLAHSVSLSHSLNLLSLSHSLTHSLTHSDTHSTHSLTHSLTHSSLPPSSLTLSTMCVVWFE